MLSRRKQMSLGYFVSSIRNISYSSFKNWMDIIPAELSFVRIYWNTLIKINFVILQKLYIAKKELGPPKWGVAQLWPPFQMFDMEIGGARIVLVTELTFRSKCVHLNTVGIFQFSYRCIYSGKLFSTGIHYT